MTMERAGSVLKLEVEIGGQGDDIGAGPMSVGHQRDAGPAEQTVETLGQRQIAVRYGDELDTLGPEFAQTLLHGADQTGAGAPDHLGAFSGCPRSDFVVFAAHSERDAGLGS